MPSPSQNRALNTSGEQAPLHSSPTPAKVFGEHGSFPQLVMALQEALISLQAIRPGETNVQPEVAGLNRRINDLVAAQAGRTVEGRLSVLNVTATHVHLLPDVTWGWPTEGIMSFAVRDEGIPRLMLPRFGVVLLKSRNDAAVPQHLLLNIGEDIPANIAKHLLWNDKLNVTFTIEQAVKVEAENALKAGFILTVKDLRFTSPPDDLKWRIRNLQFNPDIDVWPEGETLPAQLGAFSPLWWLGNLESREWNFKSFVEYASKTLRRGKAKLTVKSAAGGRILLDGKLAVRTDRDFPQVTLIPSVVGHDLELGVNDSRLALRAGDSLPVVFDVKEVTGGFVDDDRVAVWVRVENLRAVLPARLCPKTLNKFVL